MVRGCLTAVGVGIALVSAFFVATAVVEAAMGGDGKTSPGVYAGLAVFFGGTFLGGVYLAWRMLTRRPAGGVAGAVATPDAKQAPPPATEAERETRVLRFAEREHGRVTIPEVAANCEMTLAEAKAMLDRLVTLQVATIRVTERGVLVYVFPGFITDDEKAKATDF